MIPFPCEFNKPLKDVCLFAIGGPARYFTETKTKQELAERIKYCKSQNLPFFILGKGSNCLFSDRGFNGLVIHCKLDAFSLNGLTICAEAGYSFARLGRYSARNGLTGLEFAAGIPASVGGAIYMNAGANGQETADTLVSVKYLDEEGNVCILPKKELQFSYRHSIFHHRRWVIVEATFELKPSIDAKKKQKEIVDYRLETQPYNMPSAGCVFRNCEASSAGKLIDECGLKGVEVGGAKISSLHANFIVNTGNARAQDVLELIQLIKKEVRQKTGIELQQEIRVIPYE